MPVTENNMGTCQVTAFEIYRKVNEVLMCLKIVHSALLLLSLNSGILSLTIFMKKVMCISTHFLVPLILTGNESIKMKTR